MASGNLQGMSCKALKSGETQIYIYIYTALFSRVFEYIFSKLHICRYISESLYNFMEVTCIHSLLHSVSTNTQEVTPVPPQRLAAATAISRGGLGSYTCGL